MEQFDASELRSRQQAYKQAMRKRPLAQGVKEDGGAIDPYYDIGNGQMRRNELIHANNINPYRGNIAVETPEGGERYVSFWKAGDMQKAGLSYPYYRMISDNLKDLQTGFENSLFKVTNSGYENIANIAKTDASLIDLNDSDGGGRRRNGGGRGTDSYRRTT